MSEPSELVPTLIFANFLWKLGSERVFASQEGSDITEIFPKFEKSQFPNSFWLESSVKSSECRALLGDNILKESAIFSLNVKFVTPKVELSNFWACYSLTKLPTVFKNKNLEDADIK